MTDRDHFAAAALTGYNANPAWDDTDSSIVAEQAYADADAMLRERERTEQSPSGSGSGETSGSAPERQSPASERGGGQPLDVTRPDNGEAAGGRGQNTQEPVAWIVHSGDLRWFAWTKPADGIYEGPIVPLYRAPQTCPYVVGRTTQHCSLTPFALADDERGAIAYYVGTGGPDRVDATLRSLLERTK